MFTWHRKRQTSRIDYFFISEHLLNQKINVYLKAANLSGHSLISINFIINEEEKRGKGFWKFNSNHLGDKKYVEKVKLKIKKIEEIYKNEVDKSKVWEAMKLSIRNISIVYAINKT